MEFELVMEGGMAMTGKIAFEPVAEGTKVTWTDQGDVGHHLIFRYLVLFMDRMMGKTFEKSLLALKKEVEG